MGRVVSTILTLAMIAGAACAPKTATIPALPSVGAPKFPEYVKPRLSQELLQTEAGRNVDSAWMYLEAGDLRTAERLNDLGLRARPNLPAGHITAAYIALARQDARALNLFTTIADAAPTEASALVGKGLALSAAEKEQEALAAFRAALAIDPGLHDIARRVDVLTLTDLQGQLASARQAARSGARGGDARRASRAQRHVRSVVTTEGTRVARGYLLSQRRHHI